MNGSGATECTATVDFVCGDGTWVDGSEGCDDGNIESGDGCSSLCVTETGYECSPLDGSVQTCSTVCGD